MNRYSRIFHHITTEDVKRKQRDNIKLQEIKEQEKKEVDMILIERQKKLNRQKSNWRQGLTNS